MLYTPANKPIPGMLKDYSHPFCRGRVGHWLFNERAGGMVWDLSHNDNRGTLVNSPTWGGGSLFFNGSSSYVTLGANVFSSSQLVRGSISGWFKPATMPDNTFPISLEGAIWIGRYDDAGLDNCWWFCVYDGGVRAVGGILPISLGHWTQIVGTWDGTTETIYQNGLKIGSRLQGSPLLDALDRNNYIGVHWDLSGYFNGDISEVWVYNRTLLEAEVYAQYKDRVSGEYAEFPRLGISYFYLPVSAAYRQRFISIF